MRHHMLLPELQHCDTFTRRRGTPTTTTTSSSSMRPPATPNGCPADVAPNGAPEFVLDFTGVAAAGALACARSPTRHRTPTNSPPSLPLAPTHPRWSTISATLYRGHVAPTCHLLPPCMPPHAPCHSLPHGMPWAACQAMRHAMCWSALQGMPCAASAHSSGLQLPTDGTVRGAGAAPACRFLVVVAAVCAVRAVCCVGSTTSGTPPAPAAAPCHTTHPTPHPTSHRPRCHRFIGGDGCGSAKRQTKAGPVRSSAALCPLQTTVVCVSRGHRYQVAYSRDLWRCWMAGACGPCGAVCVHAVPTSATVCSKGPAAVTPCQAQGGMRGCTLPPLPLATASSHIVMPAHALVSL